MLQLLRRRPPAVPEERLLDTLVHIWVTSIYGESGSALVVGRCEHMFVRIRLMSARHPARRPRLVLRVRRAARRPGAARPPGDRRRRGGAGRQLRGQGLRRAHRDGRQCRPGGCARTPSWCRRGCRPTRGPATRCSRCSATPRRWSRPLSVDEAFLDVGGLRRVSGHTGADRGAAARRRARPGRAAHHRRHRPHEIPRQGRQPGSQARRAAAGAARSGAGVPAPAAGAPAVGRGRGDRRQAARARHRDRRRRRRTQRVDAGLDGGRGDGPPAVCAVAQHRPAPGDHRRAAPVGGRAARAGPRRQHHVARRDRRGGGRI